MLNGFLQSIAKLNKLPIDESCTDQRGGWLFYPGMLFGSSNKWWADWGIRYTPHEGLDITFYRKKIDDIRKSDNSSCGCDILSFDSSVVIPAMFDGEILNICKDFLGQSVVIRHKELNQVLMNNRNRGCSSDSDDNSDRVSVRNLTVKSDRIPIGNLSIKDDGMSEFVVVYSHILAESSLKAGQMLKKRQIIGNVADTSMRKSGIPSHLHISIAAVSTKIPHNQLNWELFANPASDSVQFFDPMRI